MTYFYEYNTSTRDDDNDAGRCYDVIHRDANHVARLVASRCTAEDADRIVKCLQACEGVDILTDNQVAVLRQSLAQKTNALHLAENLWLEAKEKWAKAEERVQALEKTHFDLVEGIATLIPAIDGERANDPIINRVKRLATIDNTGPRDRLLAAFSDVCDLIHMLEDHEDWQGALAKLNEMHNPLFDYLWPRKET